MNEEKKSEESIVDNGKFFQRVNGKLRVNKHNWKTLFKFKWIEFFLMVGIICASLLYFQGTTECRAIAANPCNYCVNSITNEPFYQVSGQNNNFTLTPIEINAINVMG